MTDTTTQTRPAHTPGPWHTGDGTVGRRIVYDARGMAIADAKVFHGNRTGGEDFANARLIAAAPELLEVAQAIEAALRFASAADVLDENSPIRDGLRAVIAKATGSAS